VRVKWENDGRTVAASPFLDLGRALAARLHQRLIRIREAHVDIVLAVKPMRAARLARRGGDRNSCVDPIRVLIVRHDKQLPCSAREVVFVLISLSPDNRVGIFGLWRLLVVEIPIVVDRTDFRITSSRLLFVNHGRRSVSLPRGITAAAPPSRGHVRVQSPIVATPAGASQRTERAVVSGI
jgi:hypothetical protein